MAYRSGRYAPRPQYPRPQQGHGCFTGAADGETFREVLPLGDGVHIVLSVGDLPTKMVDGIHEIEV